MITIIQDSIDNNTNEILKKIKLEKDDLYNNNHNYEKIVDKDKKYYNEFADDSLVKECIHIPDVINKTILHLRIEDLIISKKR
jgi:hypothetical protein